MLIISPGNDFFIWREEQKREIKCTKVAEETPI